MNHKLRVGGFVVLALAVLPSAAFAGAAFQEYVTIESTEAYGAMGSAYLSTDSYEYIGCSLTGASSNTMSLTCFAENSSADAVLCSVSGSNALTLAQSLLSIQSDSALVFSFSGTTCTEILVDTDSFLPPK